MERHAEQSNVPGDGDALSRGMPRSGRHSHVGYELVELGRHQYGGLFRAHANKSLFLSGKRKVRFCQGARHWFPAELRRVPLFVFTSLLRICHTKLRYMVLVKRCVRIAFGEGRALEVLASRGTCITGAERGVYDSISRPFRAQQTQPRSRLYTLPPPTPGPLACGLEQIRRSCRR